MPVPAKPNDVVKGYQIVEQLGKGAMAWAYSARAPDGAKVFFKEYSSPTVLVPWFEDYVKYQKELNGRVRLPSLQRFCVRHLESFVEKYYVPTFFQVYEFIEGGHDLESILDKIRANPAALNWHQRTILAKVMMAGIHQLHEQKIAHCDLKPANLQMLEDRTIEAGYQLKLIDMDFSVLSDKVAPWHGHNPYVGTPRYFSPEHLKGEVPSRESDIFTCGIILYELLGSGHPFPSESDEAYFEYIKAHKVASPKLVGSLTTPDSTQNLVDTIYKCLSPDPAERPSAREVNLALNGKMAVPVSSTPIPSKTAETPRPPEPSAPEPGLRSGPIKLTSKAGRSLAFNVTTSVGKHLLRQVDEDSRFADDLQFTLERRGLEWWITPQSGTTNFTVLNGETVLVTTILSGGDCIEIGGRASGKKIMPLKVDF